jgi:cold-inducible RNA-binding protein
MARRNAHSYERNKREQERQARAVARRARKRARAQDGPDGSDMVASPQYRDKPSDDEVQAAVERAMNPGGARRRESPEAAGTGEPLGRRLFVGNLDFSIEEAELRDFFRDKGFDVLHARLVRDRETGRPRGFAFVDLAEPTEAARAIATFDGFELAGRPLRVNPADQR